MEIASREDRKIVRRRHGRRVFDFTEPKRQAPLLDRRRLHVVASLRTDQKALLADHSVDGGNGALEEIDKCSGVEVGLLEEDVEFSTVGLAVGEVVAEKFDFQTLGKVVFELDFGV